MNKLSDSGHKAEILFQASSWKPLAFGMFSPGDRNSLMALEKGSAWSGLCLRMFRAVSHLYTILSLMLFPSSEYIIYCLGTSLVPSMERPRPSWNVTFFHVHPLPLGFCNHSFVVYPRPWVTLTLQVRPFFVSGLLDSRVELVHATSPTRPTPFRRYLFRYFSLGLIFIQRPDWNNILNLVVHFAENKMRMIYGSIQWRKRNYSASPPLHLA